MQGAAADKVESRVNIYFSVPTFTICISYNLVEEYSRIHRAAQKQC